MNRKNQLFIHPTDECKLNCSFCTYAEARKQGMPCASLDLSRGHAAGSMKHLIQGAQHTAFSGGGEPFLNTDAILSCIALNSQKKYMVTTGMGGTLEELEEKVEQLNDACRQTDSRCVLRISADSFHNTMDFSGNTGKILHWFLQKRWDCVTTCFIRGTVSESEALLNNLESYCKQGGLTYLCRRVNDFTYACIINGVFFQALLRPTIYPSLEEREKEDYILDYIDKLMQIDTEEIYLGKPRSCRGCKGCDAWKNDQENGLDITVTANGDIFLYGAECVSLGNIYNEEITYTLLHQRIEDSPELLRLQSLGLRSVMERFVEDKELGELVRRVNYPFAVVRECMREHPEAVFRVIRSL